MRTMSFRTQQYERSQGTITARHRRCTCLGHWRDPGHPTTTPRRCSDNGVVARMPRSDVLDTKRYGKPAWLRAMREPSSARRIRISPLLGRTSRLSHACPGIGD